jgi:hypothetical protein
MLPRVRSYVRPRYLSTSGSPSPYNAPPRVGADLQTQVTQTFDRLSYGYLMEDMFRGLMLTTEVMLKPKVTINYPFGACLEGVGGVGRASTHKYTLLYLAQKGPPCVRVAV